MTGLGTPPPAGLGDDKPLIAAWYACAIQEHVQLEVDGARACRDPWGCTEIQELASGAITAQVVGEAVTVSWRPHPIPLHELLGPYRRAPGGLAERSDKARAELWEIPAGRPLRRSERREWIP